MPTLPWTLVCPAGIVSNTSSDAALLYGWIISDAIVCISAVAPWHISPQDVDPDISIVGSIGQSPRDESCRFWISLQKSDADASQRPGASFYPEPPVTIIYFDVPNSKRHEYLSLHPLRMDLSHADDVSPSSNTVLRTVNLRASFPGRTTSRRNAVADLLTRINSIHEVQARLLQSCHEKATSSSTRWFNFNSMTLSPPRTFLKTLHFVYSTISALFLLLRSVAQVCLVAWDSRLPGIQIALKDASATVHQLDVRLEQVCAWPEQYHIIRKKTSSDVPTSRAHYVNLQTTLWLIANDVIVGMTVGAVLCANCNLLSRCLSLLIRRHVIQDLRETLLWLNNWPVGFKLNYELGSMFCDAFLKCTSIWDKYCISLVLPHTSTLIYTTGLCSYPGATFFLAWASDFISVATLHLYIFYRMATFLFSTHLSIIYSLFNIFRGRRYNPNTRRAEPHDYSLEVLLCGSILFTIATSLFPTVLAYYLAFAIARLGVIGLHAVLESILTFLNHFPLFALLLRIKEPARLPGGIYFETLDTESESKLHINSPHPVAILRLQNSPIKLPDIFVQHLSLLTRLSSHYSPVYLLKRLLTGKEISPIPRIKLHLSTLPVEQPSFAAWKRDVINLFTQR